MTTSHTVKAFENELVQLNSSLVTMGHVVASQFQRALSALRQRDITLADAVICDDAAVDAAQRSVDEAVVSLLALRHPVADDLRLALTTSRIAGQFERIGDVAANIGKRAKALCAVSEVTLAKDVIAMGDMAYGILVDAITSFAERNEALARQAWERDTLLDDAYTALNRDLIAHMMSAPSDVPQGTHLLFIGKNIERIGDHATNIAEMAIFLTSGDLLVEERKKTDLSSTFEGPL